MGVTLSARYMILEFFFFLFFLKKLCSLRRSAVRTQTLLCLSGLRRQIIKTATSAKAFRATWRSLQASSKTPGMHFVASYLRPRNYTMHVCGWRCLLNGAVCLENQLHSVPFRKALLSFISRSQEAPDVGLACHSLGFVPSKSLSSSSKYHSSGQLIGYAALATPDSKLMRPMVFAHSCMFRRYRTAQFGKWHLGCSSVGTSRSMHWQLTIHLYDYIPTPRDSWTCRFTIVFTITSATIGTFYWD